MNYLVVCIVNDIDDCPAIMNAWEAAGALGITILSSTGIGRMRKAGLRDDMPLLPSLQDLFESEEIQHRTLFSVVDSQELIDKMVAGAQEVIGNLDNPNNGFLFVLPVIQAYGLGKHRTDRTVE